MVTVFGFRLPQPSEHCGWGGGWGTKILCLKIQLVAWFSVLSMMHNEVGSCWCCSTKGSPPLKVVLYQRWSSIEGHLSIKVDVLQRLSPIYIRLSLKVISH